MGRNIKFLQNILNLNNIVETIEKKSRYTFENNTRIKKVAKMPLFLFFLILTRFIVCVIIIKTLIEECVVWQINKARN